MSFRPLSAVVMAAGEGTRMRSERPKPLHVLCGRPMLLHVIDALSELPLERVVVVVGHGAERVVKTLQDQGPPELVIDHVEQHVQRGTGDAVVTYENELLLRKKYGKNPIPYVTPDATLQIESPVAMQFALPAALDAPDGCGGAADKRRL